MDETSGSRPTPSVDVVGPDQWRRWRTVRLAALADAPEAFAGDRASESGYSEQDWRRLLSDGRAVIASVGGVDVGLAGGHLADGPDLPRLFGMWVAPAWRGHGVGERLVGAVVDWARAGAHDQVRLWVMDDNAPARAFYGRVGFAHDPAPPTPSHPGCEVAMVYPLRGRD